MLSTLRTRHASKAIVPAKVKLPKDEAIMVSNRAALAVLGGRFKGGVLAALSHPDFAGSSRHYVDNALAAMRKQAGAEQAAVAAEKQRRAEVEAAVERERTDALDLQRKDDAEYVAECFSHKLLVAAAAGTELSSAEVQRWATLFGATDQATLRDMSFQFQRTSWAGVVERAAGDKQPRGNAAIKGQAAMLFGEENAWSPRSITDAVKEGKEEPGETGRPCSYPKELERELIYFVSKLRELKQPVYKATVQDYAMRLIGPHEAALNFALVGDDGEYVRNEELGGFQWDMYKLDHWYYRRFLGDHPELSTGEHIQMLRDLFDLIIYLYACVLAKNILITIPSILHNIYR